MQNPETSGVAYQQGELFGYEVRGYLLEKFGRKCVYCGTQGVPLQVEHIVPKARGGSNIRQLPKIHWLDAACVGVSTPETLKVKDVHPLFIIATGHGNRQMCRVNRFGFPRTTAKRFKRVHGFQTGDIVKAVVPIGKKTGTYIGRVAVRTSGSFNVKTKSGMVQGINYRHCRLFQRADDYSY